MSTNAKKWGENFEDPLESTVVYYQIKWIPAQEPLGCLRVEGVTDK
jgi:hypothetical protein